MEIIKGVKLITLLNVFSIHLLCAKYSGKFWGFNNPSTHRIFSLMKNRDMNQKSRMFLKI